MRDLLKVRVWFLGEQQNSSSFFLSDDRSGPSYSSSLDYSVRMAGSSSSIFSFFFLILRFLSSSLSFSCFSGSLSSVSMRMLTTAGLTMSVLYFLGSGCYWVILERLALS